MATKNRKKTTGCPIIFVNFVIFVPEREPSAVGAVSVITPEGRTGIIGTDTSHVPQFVKILHAHPEWKIKVVAAFKGGSPDLPLSATRLEGFARTIQGDGVEIVDSIDTLLSTVEVFEFMTAAQLSKERGGAEVKLAELRK